MLNLTNPLCDASLPQHDKLVVKTLRPEASGLRKLAPEVSGFAFKLPFKTHILFPL